MKQDRWGGDMSDLLSPFTTNQLEVNKQIDSALGKQLAQIEQRIDRLEKETWFEKNKLVYVQALDDVKSILKEIGGRDER